MGALEQIQRLFGLALAAQLEAFLNQLVDGRLTRAGSRAGQSGGDNEESNEGEAKHVEGSVVGDADSVLIEAVYLR
ncbi:MAG TPA: hypothetical protein VHG72_06825 [Polyangia bacterium]|nr:hypothetical protein [Polyangia bacterium]